MTELLRNGSLDRVAAIDDQSCPLMKLERVEPRNKTTSAASWLVCGG